MVNLLNRDPPGRLSCLHAFLQSVNFRFDNNTFTGEAAKHIVGGKNNPIEFCTCARAYSSDTALVYGEKKYCPFLRAGSSKSCCYLVNSDQLDTQKSKAAGAAILSLEALGLCKRTLTASKRLENARLTAAGADLSKSVFMTPKVKKYYEKEVVNYGPAVAFLHFADVLTEEPEISHSKISKYMGRPNNLDKVVLSSGDEVFLNDGDAADARTRTTGAIQAWLTYAGYLSPGPHSSDAFIEADQFYCDPRNKLGYNRIFLNKEKIAKFFEVKPLVTRPLSYDFYIKGTGTAREYSQRSKSGIQLENQTLKEYGAKVRNRRLLLIYAYGLASLKDKRLNLSALAKSSNFKNSPFVIDANTHENVIVESEADFLIIAGAPYLRDSTNPEVISPRVKLDIEGISKESPFLISSVEQIVSSAGIIV
jgi:hypothetical protein